MRKNDPGRGQLSKVGAQSERRLKLVPSPEGSEGGEHERERSVRAIRRRLGRLLRALPAADVNVGNFPDVVVTQLAQCDSVTAAFLWGHSALEVEAVDAAMLAMANIERWVRDGLDAPARAAVRRRELQVRILDEELRAPLILSEWSDAFVEGSRGEGQGVPAELGAALGQLDLERLLAVARRLGLTQSLDTALPQDLLRVGVERSILRTLGDPSQLCVLVATLPDEARMLLAQLAGGGCEGCQLQRNAELSLDDGRKVEGWGEALMDHPLQQLRECGLVYLDPACRLRIPKSITPALRVALRTLAKLSSTPTSHSASQGR